MSFAFAALKNVGKYQWIMLIVYCISAIPRQCSNIGILLIAPNLAHWCNDNSTTIQNLTSDDQRRIMEPPTGVANCYRPDIKFDDLSEEELLGFNRTEYEWIPCDQGVYYDRTEFDFTAFERVRFNVRKIGRFESDLKPKTKFSNNLINFTIFNFRLQAT